MKAGDLVKVEIRHPELQADGTAEWHWHPYLGIFTGYEGSKHHSGVFVDGRKLMFLTRDIEVTQ